MGKKFDEMIEITKQTVEKTRNEDDLSNFLSEEKDISGFYT